MFTWVVDVVLSNSEWSEDETDVLHIVHAENMVDAGYAAIDLVMQSEQRLLNGGTGPSPSKAVWVRRIIGPFNLTLTGAKEHWLDNDLSIQYGWLGGEQLLAVESWLISRSSNRE